MKQIEDHDWDLMLAQIELEATDAELAAAERQLDELAADEVVAVRPEWVEATVARAMAATAVEPVPAGTQWRVLPRFRRLAAAVVAALGIQGAVAAMTATAAVVVGVVALTLIWKAGAFSSRTMTWDMALQIVTQNESPQPDDDRQAALHQLRRRIRAVITTLREVRSQADAPQAVVAAAVAGLDLIRLQLDAGVRLSTTACEEHLVVSLPIVADPAADTGNRVFQLSRSLELATTAIAAMQDMRSANVAAEMIRRNMLAQLRNQAR